MPCSSFLHTCWRRKPDTPRQAPDSNCGAAPGTFWDKPLLGQHAPAYGAPTGSLHGSTNIPNGTQAGGCSSLLVAKVPQNQGDLRMFAALVASLSTHHHQ